MDSTFEENSPLQPWLEEREKYKDVVNSEEENYIELMKTISQTCPEIIVQFKESNSNVTKFYHGSGCSQDASDDDDDDNDSGGLEIRTGGSTS